MIDIFTVSAIILAWFFALSVIWQIFVFEYIVRTEKGFIRASSPLILPAIVLSPILLVMVFKLFGVYLIFPINLLTDLSGQIRSGFFPGLVVFLASGMASSVLRNSAIFFDEWKGKPFCLMGQAYGYSKSSMIRNIVCKTSFIDSLSRCLPWVFGELFIVECIFNAPGLSYETWKAAKMEDYESLISCMTVISFAYVVIWIAQYSYSSNLKKRLSNYV